MLEYMIYGTTATGEVKPVDHGMSTFCLQAIMEIYKNKHPDVVHINIDVALDVTKLMVRS